MLFIYLELLRRVSDIKVVVFTHDVPECLTAGENEAVVLVEAQDPLAEAIEGRIDDNEPILKPSARRNGDLLVPVPTEVAP